MSKHVNTALSSQYFRRLRLIEAVLVAMLLIALFFCVTAKAAEAPTTVTAEANIAWVLPTVDTLGDPLTGPNALQKVKVYANTSSIPNTGATPVVELPPAATTFQYTELVPNGSTLYIRIAACNANCSALSMQPTKEIRVSVPGVPTGVTIVLKVNVELTEPQ